MISHLHPIWRHLAVIALTSVHSALAAQHAATDTPVAISAVGTPTISSTINVPASSDTIESLTLTLDITHTYTQDLNITLIHPDGTEIDLSSGNGGSLNDYTNTTFDQSAGTSITSASAPFTGTFRPEGNLNSLNGKTTTGNWTLRIADTFSADGGSLNSWSIDIQTDSTPLTFDYPDDDTVLALDFTSDGSGDASSFRGVNPPLGTAEGYVDFVVAELGNSQNTSTDPHITVNDITFALTGNVSAYPGVANGDLLTGDYLFLPETDGQLGASKTLQWSITGLSPSRPFALHWSPGLTGNRGFDLTSGQESLSVLGGSGTQVWVLTSDTNGEITGSITSTAREGNLAGLRISTDIPIDDSVVLPESYVWQIDFQGTQGGALGSANPITATEDTGYGSTWNAFEIEATNNQVFSEPPTNHNAIANPELLDLKDTNDNATPVALKFVPDPGNPSQNSVASAYNVSRVLGRGGIDHAYGDHWFFGGQGKDTTSLFFNFENLPPGSYELITVVNPDQHNPDRDLYVEIENQRVDIAPTHNNGIYSDSNFIGTISNITVGSDGILAGELGTLINEPGEVLGATDPSLSAMSLRLIVGDDIGEMNHGGKFRIPVLNNDSPAGDVTNLTITGAPSFGIATIQPDNTILYTHTSGTPSSDTLTYTYTDDNGVSQTGTVTINFTSGTRIPASTVNLPAEAPQGSLAIVDAFPAADDVTFEQATDIASIPGNTQRLFIAEKDGIVWEIPDMGAFSPTRRVFMDFTSTAWKNAQGGQLDFFTEMGIKSIAFHPQFQNGSPYVYVTYNFEAGARDDSANANGTARLSRFTVLNSGTGIADMLSEQVLIELDNTSRDHNIDGIAFGPDGYLYMGAGDDRNPLLNAQTITQSFWCSIIRIDVDRKAENLEPNPASFIPTDNTGKARYKVPADNPYAASSGTVNYQGTDYAYDAVRSEIYVTGTRNPWRFSFDSIDGEPVIWQADIGSAGASREEVNILHAGDNAGWNFIEGGNRTQIFTDGDGNQVTGATGTIHSAIPNDVTLVEPEFFYPRGSGTYEGASIIGGYVNKTANYPSLTGKYLFGDWINGHIWSLERTATVGEPVVTRIGGVTGVVDFHPDPSTGDILILSWNSVSGGLFDGDNQIGKLYRIRQNEAANTGLPATLTETGIFADLNDLSPNPGIHAYEPKVTFWSDNAIKTRWFNLPNTDSKITFNQDDQWQFPTGSTFVKHFDMELRRGDPNSKKRLETRILHKTQDGVYGISYQWNETGTEATIVPDSGATIDLVVDHDNDPLTASINQTWQIPSRTQCLTCHLPEANYMLGINTRQLNDTSLPLLGNYGNYLTLLNDAGFFASDIAPAASLPTHAKIDDKTASLGEKVRTYLDVNCAYCHREENGFNLRADVSLSAMNSIGVSDLGQIEVDNPDLKRIRAGHPEDSSILQRTIAADGFNRMPPIGSAITDDAGAELLITWIKQLGGNDTNADWVRLTITGPGGAYPHGNGSADVSFAGDSDGDGLSNAAEVLLGTDLRSRQHNDYIHTSTVQDGALQYREIEIELSDDLADTLTWHLDKTTNLSSWTPLHISPTTVGVTDNKRTVRFRDPAPIDAATPNRFYRIRVEANE